MQWLVGGRIASYYRSMYEYRNTASHFVPNYKTIYLAGQNEAPQFVMAKKQKKSTNKMCEAYNNYLILPRPRPTSVRVRLVHHS